MDKSAPSKESLERARKWWKALAPNSETQFIRKMALEFDAIRGSECAEVCRVALEELDGLYDYIPSVDGSLRADDAIERLRSLLSTASTNFVRERDEVAEKKLMLEIRIDTAKKMAHSWNGDYKWRREPAGRQVNHVENCGDCQYLNDLEHQLDVLEGKRG